MNHPELPDDVMFDALLAEASGGPAPPDLSDRILAALAASPKSATQAPPVVTIYRGAEAEPTIPRTHAGRFPSVPNRSRAAVASVVVAASLGLLGLFFAARDSDAPDQVMMGPSAMGPSTPDPLRPGGTGVPSVESAPVPSIAMDSTDSANEGNDTDPSGTPRHLIDLESGESRGDGDQRQRAVVLESPEFGPSGSDSPGLAHSDAGARDGSAAENHYAFASPPAKLDDQTIVTRIDQALAELWREQGLQPSASVGAVEVDRRLEELFGRPIATTAADPAASIRRALADESTQMLIAEKLAVRLLGRVGSARAGDDHRTVLARWLAPVVAGKVRFDQAASEILAARGSLDPQREDFNPAVVWYAALAAPRSVPVVEQFAHAMLDVDLRCGRCHDHPLDGRVWQGQYWQLNAVFETGLRWSATDGAGLRLETPTVLASDADPVVFYELPDGRQRAAFPRVPPGWFSGTAGDAAAQDPGPAAQIDDLARGMMNNPQLARAAVNRVWEVVYGRPLVGSPADPSAPPESPPLLKLQTELADQLRAHDFDLSRLLAWVALSAPMRLAMPAEYQSPMYESATDEQLYMASQRIRSFASYPHSVPHRPFDHLVAMVDDKLGDSQLLSTPPGTPASGTLLGQFSGDATSTGTASPLVASPRDEELASDKELERLRASMDAAVGAGSAEMPADWLPNVGGVDRFERQIEHLYYLAGYWRPSPRQMEIAHAIREASDSDAAALQRLWWVLSTETP